MEQEKNRKYEFAVGDKTKETMAMFVSSIMTKGNDKLLSSKDIEVKDVLDIYRQQDGVEKLFRLL